MMFYKYIDGLNKGEADYISSLFSEDCFFHDKAGSSLVGHDVICKGRKEVGEFFKRLLSKHIVSSELVVAYESRAYYNVIVDDIVLKCTGNIKTTHNLITELIVDLRWKTQELFK